METEFILSFSPRQLTQYCEQLAQRSIDIRHNHQSLLDLKTFIEQFSDEASSLLSQSSFHNILESLSNQVELQNIKDLTQALQQCDLTRLVFLHRAVNRKTFYHILEKTIALLTDDEIRLVMVWTSNWMAESTNLLEQHSHDITHPAFDKAGIVKADYEAMAAIDMVLNGE